MAGKVGFHFTDNVNIESQTAEGNHFNSRQYIILPTHVIVMSLFFCMQNGGGCLTDGLLLRKMFQVSEMTYRFVEKHHVDKQWPSSSECANQKCVARSEVMEHGG